MSNTDELTGATIGIELAHERTHAGKTWQCSYKSPNGAQIADDANLDVLIINGAIPIHFSFSMTAGGSLEVVFYENTTVSNNGSALNIIGMNRMRSHAPTVTAFHTPTITTVGDLLHNSFDSRGIGLGSPEAVARPATEWILKPNTNYLMRAINRAGGARDMSIVCQWYQVS